MIIIVKISNIYDKKRIYIEFSKIKTSIYKLSMIQLSFI